MNSEEEILSRQTPENLKKALKLYADMLKDKSIFLNDLFGNVAYQFCHVAKHALERIEELENKK